MFAPPPWRERVPNFINVHPPWGARGPSLPMVSLGGLAHPRATIRSQFCPVAANAKKMTKN